MPPQADRLTFDWHGIAVSVSVSQPGWLARVGTASGPYIHLEIRADVPLPITETGYRSHFMSGAVLDEWGGPLPYVCAWLDADARLPAWQEAQRTVQQLSLF